MNIEQGTDECRSSFSGDYTISKSRCFCSGFFYVCMDLAAMILQALIYMVKALTK